MKLNILQKCPGIQVHHADDERSIASKGFTVLISDKKCGEWHELSQLPCHPIYRILLTSSLYCRFAREGIHSILLSGDRKNPDWIVVAQRKIFRIISEDLQIEELSRIERGRSPLRCGICIIGSKVLWGEYWNNPERGPLNIYSIDLLTKQVETLYQFGKRSVRHIHVIQQDPYGESIWVATGDNDKECMIAILNQDTGKLEIVGQGSQNWRTVSFAFRREAVYWGTDNPFGRNYIWRYDRATGNSRQIGEVMGPVYYNASLKDYIVFGTSVEPVYNKDSLNLKDYLVLGTSIEASVAPRDITGRIYAIDLNDSVTEVWQLKKDYWNPHLFGYGIFEFSKGSLQNNSFWVTAKGFEGGIHSVLLDLKDE